MKILSNFDTQFRDKILQKKRLQFENSQILLIRRSRYYFIFEVLLPFCLIVGLGFPVLVFLSTDEYFSFLIYILFPVWLLVLWFGVGRKFLKYMYDFTFVDPQGVTTYKQKGILHSSLKQIPADRIRSIQFERNSLLENICGYGKIEIHTDFRENMRIGEEEEAPFVIGLTYVDKPYKVKSQISDICFT